MGMLALGFALGATAFAMPDKSSGPDAIKKGGTFRITLRSLDYVDPALAYFPWSWQIVDATCAKLVNYPDQDAPQGLRALPEVAAKITVSPDGKKYTFQIRPGFRFSDRAKVTARSFQRAIERLADPRMRSPAAEYGYVQDIAGADRVLSGQTSRLSGVQARGDRLVIRLTRRVPDFQARLAMPFFCAVPPALPVRPEGEGAYHSAGPYYVSEYLPGRKVTLQRNRYYGGNRPQRVNRIVVTFAGTPAEVVDQIEAGRADWGFLNARAWADRGESLMRKYRRNPARLRIRPSFDLSFYVLNSRRGIFRSNVRLRRAVNYAVNRNALVDLTPGGLASPADQYLPPAMPGFRDVQIYPNGSNLKRARALSSGQLRNRKVVLYIQNADIRMAEAQILKANLARIGLQVEIRPFAPDVLLDKILTPNEPFDMAWYGWSADYPDPYGFMNVLLVDAPYFRSPKYGRLLRRASRRTGAARYGAYHDLDVKLAKRVAPLLVYMTRDVPTFVSRKVDPRCIVTRPDLDLAAVCLR